MERNDLITTESLPPVRGADVTEFIVVGRRWRNRMASVFIATMICALFATFFLRDYESEMKIVLKKGQLDTVTSAQNGSDGRQTPVEEELNTEVELLRSD